MRPLISFETISILLPIIDLAIILGASLGAVIFVSMFYPPSASASITSMYGLGLVASGLYVFRMRDLNHYEAQAVRTGRIELRKMLQTWVVSVLVLLSLIYLFRLEQINTRRAFVAFIVISCAALIFWRVLLKWFLSFAVARNAVGRRNVFLIGEAEELRAPDLDSMLEHFGLSNIPRFAIGGSQDGPLSVEDRISLTRAVALAQETFADEALVLTGWGHTTRLAELREALRALPIPARLLPDRQIRMLTSFPSLNADYALQVELQRAPLTSTERWIKRTIDVVGAALALVVLAPLMAIVAIAIRLESTGPTIFRQRRVGFGRHEFTIYKFRTMRVQEDGDAVRQATRGDSRVTRLGRFLRATSIDELPQLLNVLRGEMSLVGPRPHATSHDHEFESGLADYAFRRHVKPGITGWAQCKGRRGPTPTPEDVRARVELDLWYIANWSLSLDFYILLRTVVVLFSQRNAV